MSLAFFWRCEGTTLDGTDDFSTGDTTASATNTPSISATAAKIGSNGILIDSSGDNYNFNPTSIYTVPSEGSVGGWFQFPTAVSTNAYMFYIRGASSNDNIRVSTFSDGGTPRLRLQLQNSTNGTSSLQQTSASISAGSWYFYLARWQSSSNYRAIELYDSSGTLLESLVDSSTSFSANVPADLNLTSGLRYGDITLASGTMYLDNLFIATNFDEPIQNNKSITSYTSYTTTVSTTVNPAQAALTLQGLAPTTNYFTAVRIREVLVSASGQAVGNATNIGVRVWYGGICAGAPDVSLNGQTTDANGTTSWSIATGTLANLDPIFFVAQNSASYSNYTCGRIVPSYE